ncbi:MAG: hypothetical protein EOM20_16500 [Spartobacteria bacterium]|nr:hypothetical protein [Spartobacteria bacterium]
MGHVVWGLILASDKDEQIASGVDTAFLNLGGRPVLSYSLEAFEKCPEIDAIAVVAPKERMAEVQRVVQLFGCTKVRRIAPGTTQRLTSLKSGLDSMDNDVTIVVYHQVSRPCISPDLISDTVKTAKRYDCGVAAQRVAEPVKIVPKGHKITDSVDPGTAWIAQMPVACRMEALQKAITDMQKKKNGIDDIIKAIEAQKKAVQVVPAPVSNIRITDADDLMLAEAFMRFQ